MGRKAEGEEKQEERGEVGRNQKKENNSKHTHKKILWGKRMMRVHGVLRSWDRASREE